MAFIAANFRSTLGYVTDLGGETFVGAGTAHGWSTDDVSATNGTSSGDYRLAGSCWKANDGTQAHKDFTLPAAGLYTITLAAGASFDPEYEYVQIRDGASTPVLTIDRSSGLGLDQFTDATDTVRSLAAWPGSNVTVNVTFATTTLRLILCPTSTQSGWSAIAHIKAEQVGAEAPAAGAYHQTIMRARWGRWR